MSEDNVATLRYILLGIGGIFFGYLSHQTHPFFVRLEQGGTPFRWLLFGRYAVGTVGLFATCLLYFVGRRLSFVDALGVFSQVALNYGSGVVIGHIVDEMGTK